MKNFFVKNADIRAHYILQKAKLYREFGISAADKKMLINDLKTERDCTKNYGELSKKAEKNYNDAITILKSAKA